MSVRSTWRGHTIINAGDHWEYEDNGVRVDKVPMRACGKCLKPQNGAEYDPCLGLLPGVLNACCGHGARAESYIHFENGVVVRGFVVSPDDIVATNSLVKMLAEEQTLIEGFAEERRTE